MANDPQSVPAAATPAPAAAPPSAPAAPPAAAPGKQGVSRIARTVVVVLLVVFIYHLFADRITPYTSQATIGTFLVQMAPQVSGQVIAVDVRDNQLVRKGQPLFRIDPVPFEIAERSAEANLAVSVQAAGSSEADVRVADAQLRGERVDLAASEKLGKIVVDLAAKRALAETSAIRARADIEKTRASLVRAQAEAERARVRLGETGNDNAQVRQALAAVDKAKLDLHNSAVVAPDNGAVTNLRLAPGQFANAGQPVMSFLAGGPRWVSAAMRENQLGNIAAGNRVWVVFDDYPGRVFDAHVESVGWGITQGNEAPNGQLPDITAPSGWLREPQRFPVRIVLDPPADPSKALPPGRSGALANVVVLTREHSLMNPLAWLWIHAIALLSYLR